MKVQSNSEVIYESDKYADTSAVRASKKMLQLAHIKTRHYQVKK